VAKRKRKNAGLIGDPKRQAVDALAGYVYQIWHSVHAWLELTDEQFLALEGAEDFDILDPEKAIAVQVKHTSANITLRSQAVIDSINHYWKLRNAYPDKRVLFRFLTRSQIGIEKGQPFGSGIAGLDLWADCSRKRGEVSKLRDFLLSEGRLERDLQEFLSVSDPEAILEHLVLPVTWETGSREAGYVEKAIERKLILHGEKNGVPPSKSASVVSRLLKEALTTACSKDERFLDRVLFLQIFEEGTTERIPIHQLQALAQAAQSASPFFPPVMADDKGLSFQAVPLIQSTIPPLHGSFAARDQIVAEFRRQLTESGVLILTGSTGMGKTVLAKLIAQVNESGWHWLNLSRRPLPQISEILRQLAIFMEQKRSAIKVVLDDIDLSAAKSRVYEDYLGGLLYTILNRNSLAVLTSQRLLPTRLLQRLRIDPGCMKPAPPFEEDEIAEFAIKLGCTEEKLAQSWAMVILLHTRGHPQLVHARLLHLADTEWPPPGPDDLLKTPSDVIRERSEARELLIEQLPEENRELVYRLSIVLGPFRRDHAVAISEIEPPIQFPGDALDKLIGPWIEIVGERYYSVSPLLENAANQVWPEEKVKSLHAAIGQKILTCGQLTTLEATKIFFHAWTSRDVWTMSMASHGIITAPEHIFKSIAHDLSWLIYVGVAPYQTLFPEYPFINYFLRMLQFRIAVVVEPKAGSKIAEAWKKEITPHEPREAFMGERLLFVTHLLLYYQVDLSPGRLLACLLELSEILEEPGEITTSTISSLKKLHLFFGAQDTFDPVSLFSGFIIPRCSSFQFLDDLLEGLKEIPAAIRKRILSGFCDVDSGERLMIDLVWLRESERETPRWSECIGVFEKTIKLATKWNIPKLAHAAARAIAIIYEEYMDDAPQAIAVLKEITKKTGSSLAMEDERATIFFHQERYEEALEVWEEVVSKWPLPRKQTGEIPVFTDATAAFACRKAGIAAARTGHWQKAALFFHGGSDRAQISGHSLLSNGLLADAGFAFWKAGKPEDSVTTFAEALLAVERLPSGKDDLAAFTLRKLVGHTLLWIIRTITDSVTTDYAEPWPGMCSNPERNQKIGELPDSRMDILWVHLAQIEYHFDIGSEVFDCVHRRFGQSGIPAVRFPLNHLNIQYAFRRMEFTRLPSQIAALAIASQELNQLRAEKKEIWEEVDINGRLDHFKVDAWIFGTDIFIGALVVLASTDKLDLALLELWCNNAKGLSIHNKIVEWVDLAKSIFSQEVGEAEVIMKDRNGDRQSRLLAAVKVCMDERVTPEALFYAHILLASSLLRGFCAKDVANRLSILLSRHWLREIRFPAALHTPQYTVPNIQAACEIKEEGIKKAAKVLLAASNAVTISTPQELMTLLKKLAN